MPEQLADVGRGVTICHESFGDAADPPLLLVMGLGMQMVGWHPDFCRELAARGFHVTRFDNRDVGRSTHFGFRPPKLGQLLSRRFPPEQYGLEEIADDAAGLVEALDLRPVHLVGASMGGMVAQVLTARRPDLVLSLASIMSNTGSRLTGQPALGLLQLLFKRPPRDRDAFIEHSVALFDVIGSPGADHDEVREQAALSFDRGADPAGTGRQLGAIVKTGNRARLLRRIDVPTVVIHGTKDKLVRPSGGRATAKAIPGARLLTIEGMGHDLPRYAWPRIIEAITENARRAGQAVGPPRAAAAA